MCFGSHIVLLYMQLLNETLRTYGPAKLANGAWPRERLLNRSFNPSNGLLELHIDRMGMRQVTLSIAHFFLSFLASVFGSSFRQHKRHYVVASLLAVEPSECLHLASTRPGKLGVGFAKGHYSSIDTTTAGQVVNAPKKFYRR